jgi:hypothetical protein
VPVHKTEIFSTPGKPGTYNGSIKKLSFQSSLLIQSKLFNIKQGVYHIKKRNINAIESNTIQSSNLEHNE